MDYCFVRRARGWLAVVLLAWLSAWCGPCQCGEPSGDVQAVSRLRYEPSGFSLSVTAQLEGEKTPFRGEPKVAGAQVTRAWVTIERSKSVRLACVWDRAAAKVHLDLNGNQDLSDDPAVALTEGGGSWRASGIRLLLGDDTGRREYVVDWRSDSKGSDVSLTVRSGWKGTIQAQGRAWRVTVADNLDGVLDSADALTVRTAESALASPVKLQVPALLCLDGASGAVSFRLETAQTGAEVVAGPPKALGPVGQLKIEGTSIGYLTLGSTDGGRRRLAAFASPEPLVTLPVGTYRGRVWLKGCPKGMSLRAQVNESIEVREGEVTKMKAGGPLNSIAHARREGSILGVDYRLEGIGGEEYTKQAYAPPNRPWVTITKGSRVCVSDVFEYG